MTTPTNDPPDTLPDFGPVSEDMKALARLYSGGFLTAAQFSSVRAKVIKAAIRQRQESARSEAALAVDRFVDSWVAP